MLTISKKTLIQYILLYMLLLSHGAGIILNSQWFDYLLLFIPIIVCIIYKRQPTRSIFIFAVIFILGCMLVRFNSGGVGLSVMVKYLGRILCAWVAVEIDREKAPTNYIKLVTFFSVISWIHFLAFTVYRPAVNILLPFRKTVSEGVVFLASPFYAANANTVSDELARNTGLFTEPALFVIVLNCAFFLCLFCRDFIDLDDKQYFRCLCMILVTIITTFSTTGYLTCIIMLLFYIIVKGDRKINRKIYIISALILVIAVAEVVIRKDDSIVMNYFVSKLFTTDDGIWQFDMSGGTGKYRTSTMAASWMLFLKNPFGLGYDTTGKYLEMYSLYGDASAGGGIVYELASLGIIVIGVLLWYLIRGVYRLTRNVLKTVAFIALFVISTMSSSTAFYAAYIFVAVLGWSLTRKEEKDEISQTD